MNGQTNLFIHPAKSMGVSEDEVLALLDLGYDPREIEKLLYSPALLHEAAAERGEPIARFDKVTGKVFLEYSDGRREYV